MRVLHLISSGGFYGAESMLLALAEAQSRAGLRPVVGVFLDEREPHVELFDRAAGLGIEAHLIPCAGRWDQSAVDYIRALLERRVTLLHCHGYKADVYGFGAAGRRRIPLIATCHNWPDKRISMRAYAMLDRFILGWFDQVTTPSGYVAATLKRATVVENGIDVARFQNAEPTLRRELPRHEILIGVVGRLVREKGGEVLLRAAKTVLAASPETAFVFVGDGPSRRAWKTLAADLGIGEHVFFTGTRTDMPNVYASLDMLVLPSFEEAMPMCLLEGLAAGRPVIATRVGEVPKLIEPGVTGALIESNDSAALSDAILRFIENTREAQSMGRNGQALIARSFSSDAMARKYLSVYEDALSRRRIEVTVSARKVDAA
jgi:glycosyltransferase involved in cell wall biosynthesis